jgi:hypothetical protein
LAGTSRLAPKQAKPAAPPIPIHFVVSPYATITVDDEPQPRTAQAVPTADLLITPGPHKLTYSAGNDAFFPFTETIEIGPRTSEIRQALRPKPARLVIVSQPPDASIIVDGVSHGSAADSAQRPIILSLDKPIQKARVRVFKAGYADWAQDVDLRANEEKVLKPKLQIQGGP